MYDSHLHHVMVYFELIDTYEYGNIHGFCFVFSSFLHLFHYCFELAPSLDWELMLFSVIAYNIVFAVSKAHL